MDAKRKVSRRQGRPTSAGYAFPNGGKIRILREQKGWLQVGLARRAGLSKDAISRIERGFRCELKNLVAIAGALGCVVAEITREGSSLRWAMMDEILTTTATRIGEETNALRHLLRVLEEEQDPAMAERELLLALMVRRDVMDNVDGALRLGQLLIEETGAEEVDLDHRIRVRMASVCDHAGDVHRGLTVLRPIVRHLESEERLTEEHWWARLQQGILLASRGPRGIEDARRILRQIEEGGPTEALKTAAKHQLGVLDLRTGALQQAETRLAECLQRRRASGTDDFRIAYEHRRLSEVYTKQADSLLGIRKQRRLAMAERHSKRAASLAKRWSFARYAKRS